METNYIDFNKYIKDIDNFLLINNKNIEYLNKNKIKINDKINDLKILLKKYIDYISKLYEIHDNKIKNFEELNISNNKLQDEINKIKIEISNNEKIIEELNKDNNILTEKMNKYLILLQIYNELKIILDKLKIKIFDIIKKINDNDNNFNNNLKIILISIKQTRNIYIITGLTFYLYKYLEKVKEINNSIIEFNINNEINICKKLYINYQNNKNILSINNFNDINNCYEKINIILNNIDKYSFNINNFNQYLKEISLN